MTILLTKCKHCGSNYMMLNTEREEGECVACGKGQKFSREEIAAAEQNRDALSDRYVGKFEKAYEVRDKEAMVKLAKEVAEQGISSWYAWFCVGWADYQEGKVSKAFEDFNLAACFIDEEDFDEFYELVMDATIESMLDAVREGKEWNDGEGTIIDFTQVMFERFEHLMDCDFMTDLLTRMGALIDSVETAEMGSHMLNEIISLIIDYGGANTYMPDIQGMLNAAKASAEAIGEEMRAKAQDRTMSPNTVELVASGTVETIQGILDYADSLINEYSEEDLFALSQYWAMNDYDPVVSSYHSTISYHIGYILSGKRNKGILKKKEQAFDNYKKLYLMPLEEHLIDGDPSEEKQFDGVCPDCGKPLAADETGLMRCDCGFKSRVVTSAIDDLPEDTDELKRIGRKAILDKDPAMLNNVGEKYLDIDRDTWYGFYALGTSCMFDGEVSEALMLYGQGLPFISAEEMEEFSGVFVDAFPKALMEQSEEDAMVTGMFLTMFYSALKDSPAGSSGLPMRILEELAGLRYDSSLKGELALLVADASIACQINSGASLTGLKDLLCKAAEIRDAVEKGMGELVRDQFKLKNDVMDMVRNLCELHEHAIAAIDGCCEKLGGEKIGYLAGYWESREDEYNEIVWKLVQALSVDIGEPYKKNSAVLKKKKGEIDDYLESYTKPSK